MYRRSCPRAETSKLESSDGMDMCHVVVVGGMGGSWVDLLWIAKLKRNFL